MSTIETVTYVTGKKKTKAINIRSVPNLKATNVLRAVRNGQILVMECKTNTLYVQDLARTDAMYCPDIWERDKNLGECLVKLGHLTKMDLEYHIRHRQITEAAKTTHWQSQQVQDYARRVGLKFTPEQKKFLKAKKVL